MGCVVHVILAKHGETGVTLMSVGAEGDLGGGKQLNKQETT